jgi:SAM-dependent methyltransferase
MTMERVEWLKQMREMAEALYDHFSPEYWVRFGLYENAAHREYLQKFLERVPLHSNLLSAACGAGRYDGFLLEGGHSVFGIDQSAGMLALAREHFPEIRYEKMGLQEMAFHEVFDGAICMDAMEHIPPEDYPVILRKFQEALKPGGLLYFTAEPFDTDEDGEVQASYERARAMGLPVVRGEVADEVATAYEQVKTLEHPPAELAHKAVYYYAPPLEQVRAWIAQAGLTIEEEGRGSSLHHFIVRKR